MKPFASVLDASTSLSNHTGSWRTERPVYVHRLPPCNAGCPAGENIQEWLSLVEEEKYEEAWREIVKNNPLPATMGRVCYHPCEVVCNRKDIDKPVGINSVERFLGDLAISKGWKFEKEKASGKKVLVIGAGPAGLSAAYHLAIAGHKVTIMESLPKAGGMMRYGIPSYRLPRKVLDAEIKRIEALGVEIKTKAKVEDVAKIVESKAYDAVFVAPGAQLAKTTKFETDAKAKIFDAVQVLRDMEGRDKPKLGKKVVVYGGGNTALDVARTAVRLGAKEVTIVYRRTREKMPAHSFEVDEALEEKVILKQLVTIKSYKGKTLTLEKMKLDDKGFPQPTKKTEKMEADSVVLALGQDADLSPLASLKGVEIKDGVIQIGPNMMTGCEGLFAGGDAVPSQRTVTIGIGHGKKAARNIDAWLKGETYTNEKHDPAEGARLNKWYYEHADRKERDLIDDKRRRTTFDEVVKPLSTDDALFEARRCLSCGNCFECDNCYGVCPDNAIKKLGKGKKFEINYDYCKGCGICAAECPCGCIEMHPEDK
jgi:NADPH-dependent glutamate synthase beta subunit-like oxidoreductase